METVLSILLVLNVILLGAGVWLLARALERLNLRLSETSKRLDALIDETGDLVRSLQEITPLLVSRTEMTVGHVERLSIKLYDTLEHADRALKAIEKLANAISLTTVATRAAHAATGGVVSLLTGIREGLRTLRHKKDAQEKEVPSKQDFRPDRSPGPPDGKSGALQAD